MKFRRLYIVATLFGSFLLMNALTARCQFRLNEVMADNKGALVVGQTTPDYVEIYNTNASSTTLDGWTLTDNTNTPPKFIFPANTSIPGHGYLVVYCDAVTNEPGIHTGFSFKVTGEEVALYQNVTNVYVLRDHIIFGLQVGDMSISRVPDGTGAWTNSRWRRRGR